MKDTSSHRWQREKKQLVISNLLWDAIKKVQTHNGLNLFFFYILLPTNLQFPNLSSLECCNKSAELFQTFLVALKYAGIFQNLTEHLANFLLQYLLNIGCINSNSGSLVLSHKFIYPDFLVWMRRELSSWRIISYRCGGVIQTKTHSFLPRRMESHTTQSRQSPESGEICLNWIWLFEITSRQRNIHLAFIIRTTSCIISRKRILA